ncbi:Uncharacterised protein [Peptoniphilus harei]|uniref:Uncharacterized protein n=1 Tax=Peptoniphilus harei TaxID=54005 RepID=A0A2X1WSB5_9FIRM|nr:Uncharacterised protein [Peptoniphilus harei]
MTPTATEPSTPGRPGILNTIIITITTIGSSTNGLTLKLLDIASLIPSAIVGSYPAPAIFIPKIV